MNDSVEKALQSIEIPEELHERVVEGIGRLEAKGTDVMKRSVIKIAAIAAAAAVVALGSVTAAAFSGVEGAERALGFSGKEQAFGTAATYVVKNAETKEQSDYLANLILSGMTYDIDSEDSEVTLGLLGLRPAYTVKFKVGGYSYEVVVDARSEVVLDCKSTVDENWESYVKDELGGKEETMSDLYSGYDVKNIGEYEGVEIDLSGTEEVYYAVKDYYGLDAPSEPGCDGCLNGQVFISYETPIVYVTQFYHGGYIYENRYDPSTGELTELYVGEDESFSGENSHRHEHVESGRIGCLGAFEIARGEGLGHAIVSYIADYAFEDGRIADIYAASAADGSSGEQRSVTLYIDAYTGEILDISYGDIKSGAEEAAGAPELPSAEPPAEGLISEAEAAAAVLERENASLQTVEEFKIEYDEAKKVYTVSFITENGKGRSVSATVNAESGEILG